MQKIQKNTLTVCLMCLIILFVSLCVLIPTTFAEESDLTDKELFAIEAKAKFAKIAETSPALIADDPDTVLEQLTYLTQIGANEDVLNQFGFFTYVKGTPDPSDGVMPTADSDDGMVSSNSPADVSLESPSIIHHTTTNTWQITTKGQWKNNRWNTQNAGARYGNKGGYALAVGDLDYVGFKFSDVTKDYASLNITRTAANLTLNEVPYYKKVMFHYEDLGVYQTTSTSVHDASGAAGVLMEFQDCVVTQHQDTSWYDYSYNAKSFVMTASYNSNFDKLSGNVSTVMYHDYKKQVLDDITVTTTIDSNGVAQMSFSFNYKNKDYGWTAYSGTQTRF